MVLSAACPPRRGAIIQIDHRPRLGMLDDRNPNVRERGHRILVHVELAALSVNQDHPYALCAGKRFYVVQNVSRPQDLRLDVQRAGPVKIGRPVRLRLIQTKGFLGEMG